MRWITYDFLFLMLLIPVAQCSIRSNNNAGKVENKFRIMERDSIINRKPAVAGSFYPSGREELMKDLEKLFTKSSPSKHLNNIVAVVSPHAGYIYSGEVAASAFNQLSSEGHYENVFLIGSSHHESFDGAALYSDGNYITPLGTARVNLPLTRKLIAENPEIFISLPDVQANEHSLEVQLPFLQYLYKDQLQIIPIVIATQKQSTLKRIADALTPYFGGNNLFVISTDFSHYPGYNDALVVDKATSEAILKNSSTTFITTIQSNEKKGIQNLVTSICGWSSVFVLLNITEKIQGIRYHEIQYMNSGDGAYGSKSRVVGYHAMAITCEPGSDTGSDKFDLSLQEKEKLLQIARNTISVYLENGKIPEIDQTGLSKNLLAKAGAFVTLNKEGNLRGCIGHFNADLPLFRVVQEMAISAATMDYRFGRVSKDELDHIEIEISVLTPMHKIKSINEIELGKHGIYIKKGSSSGTFLPQVADQTGWNLEEFLGHCARDKAGIGWSGWKEAEIYIYEAYVFSEH